MFVNVICIFAFMSLLISAAVNVALAIACILLTSNNIYLNN